MPSLRLHKLRPTQAIATGNKLIIPKRLQQNSFNLLVGDLGGGTLGFKKGSTGELEYAHWRGWFIDTFTAVSPGDLIDIHGEFVDQAPQALASIDLTYFEPTLDAQRTVSLPFVVSQYEGVDALLTTVISDLLDTGVPFQCKLEIP